MVKDVDSPKSLRDYCRNATNRDGDTFVGIKSVILGDKHEISVSFPIGYKISKKDEYVRKEILELISVLQAYEDRQSLVPKIKNEQVLNTNGFPVQSYFRIMQNYLQYGYYKEKEELYVIGLSGSVNMKKTISKIQPIVQKSGFVYPTLMVRKNNDTDKDIITEINIYCVYESFMKLGWLYKQTLPQRPKLNNPNFKVYRTILQQKLAHTNKDNVKNLIQNMLAIIDYKSNEDDSIEFYFGTNRFEYIWEKLIDDTYGIKTKNDYFPKTSWKLNFSVSSNAAIEPDSIMITDDFIFVLDAKYYKYGISMNGKDLPRSTDINKQISYAEYIAENEKFKEERASGKGVLNAFLMPFSMYDNNFNTEDNYFSIGEAVADWKQSINNYERVQGILIDVKTLIANRIKPNKQEIQKLSKAIEKSINDNM